MGDSGNHTFDPDWRAVCEGGLIAWLRNRSSLPTLRLLCVFLSIDGDNGSASCGVLTMSHI